MTTATIEMTEEEYLDSVTQAENEAFDREKKKRTTSEYLDELIAKSSPLRDDEMATRNRLFGAV